MRSPASRGPRSLARAAKRERITHDSSSCPARIARTPVPVRGTGVSFFSRTRPRIVAEVEARIQTMHCGGGGGWRLASNAMQRRRRWRRWRRRWRRRRRRRRRRRWRRRRWWRRWRRRRWRRRWRRWRWRRRRWRRWLGLANSVRDGLGPVAKTTAVDRADLDQVPTTFAIPLCSVRGRGDLESLEELVDIAHAVPIDLDLVGVGAFDLCEIDVYSQIQRADTNLRRIRRARDVWRVDRRKERLRGRRARHQRSCARHGRGIGRQRRCTSAARQRRGLQM